MLTILDGLKNLLRTAGSIKCLKFIIESASFNPFNMISSKYPFQVILKPIYVALGYMNGQIYTLGIRIPVEIPENILLLFYGLINPGRWLRITVFLAVTSPYTAVYEEMR